MYPKKLNSEKLRFLESNRNGSNEQTFRSTAKTRWSSPSYELSYFREPQPFLWSHVVWSHRQRIHCHWCSDVILFRTFSSRRLVRIRFRFTFNFNSVIFTCGAFTCPIFDNFFFYFFFLFTILLVRWIHLVFTLFSVAQNVKIIANFVEDFLRRRKWDERCCCHTIVSIHIHSIEHQHRCTSRWIDCRWENTTGNGIRAHALFNWLQPNSDVYRRINYYSLIFGCSQCWCCQNHWQQSNPCRLQNKFLHLIFSWICNRIGSSWAEMFGVVAMFFCVCRRPMHKTN